jgi:isoleucyl-tRNA synthetase
MWQILVAEVDPSAPRSVHHADMPRPDESLKDAVGIRRTHLARAVVELGRSLRSAHDLKVRQALATLTVVPRSDEAAEDLLAMREVILEELNVKALEIERDESHLVSLSARPNFKTLGKKLGPALKSVGEALKALSQEDLRKAASGEAIVVDGHELSGEDLLIDRATKGELVVLAAPEATVALDPRVTPELRRECMARELQARIQARRKELDLAVTDRVRVVVRSESDEIAQVLAEHGATLADEVQADALSHEATPGDEAKVEGVPVAVVVEKV